jgi:hypothetical protein
MTPSRHEISLVTFFAAVFAACGGDVANETTSGEGGTGAGGQNTGAAATAATLVDCPADTTVEPPHTDIVGVYSVPVPADLEPYASYDVPSITSCRRGDVVELGYKLPALLVGQSERVSFAGDYDAAADAFVLLGDGTATCEVVAGTWTCLEQFTGITVDLAGVADEAVGLSAEEQAARLDVAQRFGGDPIGIMVFSPTL